MLHFEVNFKFESGVYYFFYAGRRRILLKKDIDELVKKYEGEEELTVSESIIMEQMIEIEMDLMVLN